MDKESLYNELVRLSKQPGGLESMPAIVSNQFIQQLKASYVKLQADYSDLGQKFGPEHPRMISLKSQIDEIKNRIDSEVQKIARSIETEYEVAKSKEQALLGAMGGQKREALELNETEIQYNVYKRDVDTNRSLYNTLLTRVKETNLTENLKTSNIAIVDAARVPSGPVKPKKNLNLLLGFMVGAMMGVGLAFFFE